MWRRIGSFKAIGTLDKKERTIAIGREQIADTDLSSQVNTTRGARFRLTTGGETVEPVTDGKDGLYRINDFDRTDLTSDDPQRFIKP